MIERHFLGWDEPFLELAADWLLRQGDVLAEMLLVVPTGQAGRRLGEELTRRSEALLIPRMMTPGALMSRVPEDVAPTWAERVAWTEILRETEDWDELAGLFPVAPATGNESYVALAGELLELGRSLQESGHTLESAAVAMRGGIEEERWESLAVLERRMELKLGEWKMRSRSRTIAEGIFLPPGARCLVLAGITEMPVCVERSLMNYGEECHVLVGAPSSLANEFSPVGIPLTGWSEVTMPWPEDLGGSVQVSSDARQQAVDAVRTLAMAGTAAGDLALGSADLVCGEELVRELKSAGWVAFHPAASMVPGGLMRWMRAWRAWLADSTMRTMADLLALPETDVLLGGARGQVMDRLARFRDQWMPRGIDDLRRRVKLGGFHNDMARQSAEMILSEAETLETLRVGIMTGNAVAGMRELLEMFAKAGDEVADEAAVIGSWWLNVESLAVESPHDALFWMDLMLADFPDPTPVPPEGRVVDVQGWLELFFEKGRHLVICGMNEGNVPGGETGSAWLGEAAAKLLGLRGRNERAARDAFLFRSMVEARRNGGRVDVFCAKTGAGGQPLLPSRFLMRSERADLPGRVRRLFREVPPPEAGLRPQRDWLWEARPVEVPVSLPVTAFERYLECPFRFYLARMLRMNRAEPERNEWNARDFGNLTHAVLEAWGRDTDAREIAEPTPLAAWLSDSLDEKIREMFSGEVPLAIRIQTESLRQRLVWLARTQALLRAEGWRVIEVEVPLLLNINGMEIHAKIDRIDQHSETGALRVIDYKTGRVDAVEKAHLKKISERSPAPTHLGENSPAIFWGEDKGKPVASRWTNLQLPLYAHAARASRNSSSWPTPCYFTLGATADFVALQTWDSFDEQDAASAWECAAWIIGQIRDRVFWPPAEKVTYDPFAVLCSGSTMEECFAPLLVRSDVGESVSG